MVYIFVLIIIFFFRIYLENLNYSPPHDQIDNIINTMLESISFFIKVSHLFWGIWALTQSLFSAIHFDFLM